MDDLNSVNAEQGEVVEPQSTIDESIDYSENTQEVADPVNIQSQNENSKYAAARRESELKLKEYENMLQMEREKANKFAKKLGYESFDDVQNRLEEELTEKQRLDYQNKYGIDPEALTPLIQESIKKDPIYKEIQEIKKAREVEVQNANIQRQINAFNKEFNTVLKDVNDVAKLPNIDKMMTYFERGLDLVDAYKLINFNEIIIEKGKAAIKAENISNSGRNHLGSTVGTSETVNTTTVPKDILEKYKKKGLSEEKIRKLYKQAYNP
jgi:hypothetical protein